MLRITEKQRKELKKPFGKIRKKTQEVARNKLIAVGDIVSYNFIKSGIRPHVLIYDTKECRRPVRAEVKNLLESLDVKSFALKNNAGTISDESWNVIRDALESGGKIRVEGEEDLLVIPCIMLSSEGTTVCYGQPNKGVIEIKVNEKVRERTKKIIQEMEVVK